MQLTIVADFFINSQFLMTLISGQAEDNQSNHEWINSEELLEGHCNFLNKSCGYMMQNF